MKPTSNFKNDKWHLLCLTNEVSHISKCVYCLPLTAMEYLVLDFSVRAMWTHITYVGTHYCSLVGSNILLDNVLSDKCLLKLQQACTKCFSLFPQNKRNFSFLSLRGFFCSTKPQPAHQDKVRRPSNVHNEKLHCWHRQI